MEKSAHIIGGILVAAVIGTIIYEIYEAVTGLGSGLKSVAKGVANVVQNTSVTENPSGGDGVATYKNLDGTLNTDPPPGYSDEGPA